MLFAGIARAETLEIAYPEDPAIEQGPGHFAFDFLRAAEMVVEDSGLSVRWVSLPNQRALHMLQQGDANFCIGGAGVIPDRRDLGKFSMPFIEDRMIGVIALKSHRADFDRAHSLAELIRRARGDFLTYTGFNYGDRVTPQLEPLRQQGRLSEVPHNTGQMLDMLKRGRADFALVSQTYGANYLAALAETGDFIVRSYPDMHRDFPLAFLCSRAVPDEVIEKLDQAVQRQAPAIQARFPDQVK
ncbi:MAG TPA: transporter substrate-binding domain-containing protein [Magnetospirillaceae bacterium]|nr:transporter substrate-binding domain-containing protein [Magnetospirillaceae bacterium]